MKRIEYWEVGDSYDEDGRGPFKAIANFSTEKLAIAYANGDDRSRSRKEKNGRGNYGNPAQVNHKILLIIDSIDEETQMNEERIRQAALSKLTPEEKKVLGL